ncbi:MAG TPA: AAA family ATPase [Desulfosporosinus sp.]|nr:AAA family ATPase [Desulfosporosinus sp.]
MKIKRIGVKGFIGITEQSLDLGKINIITGRVGSGKTSIVEAIQKGFTNQNERVEVIRHGEEEATIFIQTDTGLEIDRKIRTNKTDYLKVRKPGEAVPSSEKYLKQFINGDLFRPLEFVEKSPSEQAKIILNMLEIPWNMDDIQNWFGECPSVNYEAHILQVLGQIVAFYFAQRESINREIAVLKAQVAGYRNELPPNYDGNEWRDKKVAEYYKAVHDAEQVNKSIDTAKNLIEGLEGRIATVKAEAETDKQIKLNQMNLKRNEIREFNQSLKEKINKSTDIINGIGERIEASKKATADELTIAVAKAKDEYQAKVQELKEQYEHDICEIGASAQFISDLAVKALDKEESKARDDVSNYRNSVTVKAQEYANIDELEAQSLLAISEKADERIKTEDAKVGNARETLVKTVPVEVEPLRLAADKVASMQSYLRDFDLMSSMIREKLAPREELSKTLTQRIEKGREMPMELLKIAALPIPGITVDGEGLIRIGETLIDGLSEGEQLELAFRVAKAQAGELKLICLDGWNKINPSDREWIEKEIAGDEFQYIILETTDSGLKVKIERDL